MRLLFYRPRESLPALSQLRNSCIARLSALSASVFSSDYDYIDDPRLRQTIKSCASFKDNQPINVLLILIGYREQLITYDNTLQYAVTKYTQRHFAITHVTPKLINLNTG